MRNHSISLVFLLTIAAPGCGGDTGGLADGGTDGGGGGDASGSTQDLSSNAVPDLLPGPPDLVIGGPCTLPTSCYSDPKSKPGTGACRSGTSMCVNGLAGPCVGEVLPSTESCNNIDDDCNGLVDDNLPMVTCGVGACQRSVPACTAGKPTACIPKTPLMEMCGNKIDDDCNGLVDEGCACVYVGPNGNDMNMGTIQMPKKTIQAAIAVAGMNGLPTQVCVASGLQCPSQADYPEDLVMRDGIQVYGGYAESPNKWTRGFGCVTTIRPTKARGVSFDKSVVTPTILDGFTVIGHADPTSAAITIEGSTGAVVSNDIVTGGGTMTSYGVNVIDAAGTKATPLLSRNQIVGGPGATLAVGVRSLDSAPIIRGNCDTIDNMTGRCTGGCGSSALSIRSRSNIMMAGTDGYAVRLESSPGATVEQNALCGTSSTGDMAAVRLSGDGTGILVRANSLSALGASKNAVGVWADPCGGASPWILDNQSMTGSSTLMGGRGDGVRAVGDCHVRIDSNVRILGGAEGAQNDANGVLCAKDLQSGISSRCTVLDNADIRGSNVGFPPQSTGVRCEDGACARIEKNVISAVAGIVTYGVYLNNTGTFVNANRIDAGCASREGTGLLSNNSFARVQNNFIVGANCQMGGAFTQSTSVRVLTTAGLNEIDLHSNTLFGGGTGPNNCTTRALALDVPMGAMPPAGPLGVMRNNILQAGICPIRYPVEEQNAAADPRLFENNDLTAPANMLTALYRDENMTDIKMLTAVNMLTGAASNLNVDPMFTSFHIGMGSPCIDRGISTGAPTTDVDGDPRPLAGGFDIGYDEFKP